MELSDFYSPLAFPSLLIWLLFILTGEIVGSIIATKVKMPHFTRPFWWVIGMMVVVNTWYFLYSLIGFNQILVCLLFIASVAAFGKKYFKDRLWLIPRSRILACIFPLLFLLPLVNALKVKALQPPGYPDEIGYHYFSPAEILSRVKRKADLYFYLPQGLDNVYRLSFSLSRTYTTSRLIHLTIAISALLVVGLWIKGKVGRLPYLFWSFSCWYLATNFVSTATAGQIDMGTAATVLVGILLICELLETKKIELILPLGVIWGIATGYKFTSLVPLAAYSLVSLFFLTKTLQSYPRKTLKYLTWGLILFIVYGGFWLIRNFALLGNLLHQTGNLNNFFDGWTVPIDFSNPTQIFKELFTGNQYFAIPLIITIVMFFSNFRKVGLPLKLILIGWLTEWLAVAYLGGFIIRYYFHWIYISHILILSVWQIPGKRTMKTGFLVLVCLMLFIHSKHVISFVYGTYFTPELEEKIANNEIALDNLLKLKFPQTYQIVELCSKFRGRPITIYAADPNIIWVTKSSDIQGYFVGCYLYQLDLGYDNSQQMAQEADPNVLIFSINDCNDSRDLSHLVYIDPNDDNWDELRHYPYSPIQRKLNNDLVCSGKKVAEHLWSVDRETFIEIYKEHDDLPTKSI